MSKYQRHICLQALLVLNGWISLRYGWGLEPKNMGVLLWFLLTISLGLAHGQAWVMRGKGGGK